jgi:hypothetical protein
MGKRRAEHSFEDNPFVDDFLEWMGSSEGERSVDALDRVYAALENADVDARQRKIVWPEFNSVFRNIILRQHVADVP